MLRAPTFARSPRSRCEKGTRPGQQCASKTSNAPAGGGGTATEGGVNLGTPSQDMIPQAGYASPAHGPQLVVSADNTETNKRFDALDTRINGLCQQIDQLQITFEKILNSILKNKTKQITIKFDDGNNTK